MMPRWVWFAPLALMVLALGIWSFRMGMVVATLTETDVIETYAGFYVETLGAPARLSDCTATPGQHPEIWILVSCLSGDGRRFDYPVDRFGRLLTLETQPEAVHGPEA
jgi:hypothetical protein